MYDEDGQAIHVGGGGIVRILPVLFNTDMVRAILDGRKTVTRRVVKPQPKLICAQDGYGPLLQIKKPKQGVWFNGDPNGVASYRPGDVLYVREAWSVCDNLWDGTDMIIYRASHNGGQTSNIKWRPSIHMHREAARIFLRVTDVQVERLGEITEEQAQAEGFYKGWKRTEHSSMALSATQAFMWMWDYTIKPTDRILYGWAANPWVWVIEFERCEKPEG